MIVLDKDEHVLFEVRKHWFILASETFILFLLAIAPFIVDLILNSIPYKFLFESGNVGGIVIFLYAAWALILWTVGFVFWTNHYLDVWIITNKQLIDVEQVGLFRREISYVHLNKIQDVTSEIHGLIPTLMKFGDLHVQSAGQQREFVIRNVESPGLTRERLNNALTRIREDGFDSLTKNSI